MPYTRELFEIGFKVFLITCRGIGRKECGGLAWEWDGTDEITGFAVWDGVSAGRISGYCHAEGADLDFAGVDGGERRGRSEEGNYVCAACYGTEVYGLGEGAGGVDVFIS